jgi:hypothetical protein
MNAEEEHNNKTPGSLDAEETCLLHLSPQERELVAQALALKIIQLEGDIRALDPEFAELKQELAEELQRVKSLQTRVQYAVGY